mmetsp:Transcript_20911/g.40517  ORF Transcript_20911/g.40517 Transcript_20911/m.40517 type:complete len:374 (-) Transcript_20911:867-1988(-)
MDDEHLAQRRAPGDVPGGVRSHDAAIVDHGHQRRDAEVSDLGITLLVEALLLRNHEEVHAVLGVCTVGDLELAVHVLDEEGGEGSHQAAHRVEHLEEGLEAAEGLVEVAVRALHSVPVVLDVLVGEVFDEPHELRDDRVQVVGLHFLTEEAHELVEAQKYPLVHLVGGLGVDVVSFLELLPAHHLVAPGVLQEEAHGVVPWEEDLLDDTFDTLLLEPELLGTDNGRVYQVQPQRVRAVVVDDLPRVRVVLQPLGHLLAVSRQHQPVDDEILEGGLAKESRGDDHERVEPSACLVESLGDEVGGELGFEALLVLERVVELAVGHGSGLEPAVEDFGGALHGGVPFAPGVRDGDMVNLVAVDVRDRLRVHTRGLR